MYLGNVKVKKLIKHNKLSMPKQRLKRKRSKDSENDDRPKKRLRFGDDFMLDSDELRSDDEMLVKTKPKPKRKVKRKRQQQKLKPIFKKHETVNNRQFF